VRLFADVVANVHMSHPATDIFLNCTKNTELTAHAFARTFTFALSQKKNQLDPRQQPARDKNRQSSAKENRSALMKANKPWITYRTRFLVKAKQLTSSLIFTDALGREHSGRKGDYLVESSDGVLRIAPRQIFEDIYVPLLEDAGQQVATKPGTWRTEIVSHINETQTNQPQINQPQASPVPTLSAHMIRKAPQSDRGRRSLISQSV
jgi:hypothetical protein